MISESLLKIKEIKEKLISTLLSSGKYVTNFTDVPNAVDELAALQFDDSEMALSQYGSSALRPSVIRLAQNVKRLITCFFGVKEVHFPVLPKVEDASDAFCENSDVQAISIDGFPKVTSMVFAFAACPELMQVSLGEMPECESLERCFSESEKLTRVDFPAILPKVRNLDCCFYGCSSMQHIDLSCFPSVTSMVQCFESCTNLVSVILPDLRALGSFKLRFCFSDATSLENISILGSFPDEIGLSNIGLDSCERLSVESLLNIINALSVQTDGNSHKLKIGEVNIAKLTDDQIAVATNKGWTLV